MADHGFAEVASAVAASGWGLLPIALYHVVPLFLFTLGWRCLLPRRARPSPAFLLALRWIGESVNNLLPVVQVGGEVVRARLAARAGLGIPRAGASVVADITAGLATEMIFALAGVAILLAGRQGSGGMGALAGGLLGVAAILITFYALQRRGLFRWLARVGGRAAGWKGLAAKGEALDRDLEEIYSRPGSFFMCATFRLLGWTAGAGEVWLAFHFLGLPFGFGEAVLLESLSQATRTVAFMVPAGLGVQEGGFLLLGRLLAMPPEAALSVALLKRGREILLALPGIAAWQFMEARAREAPPQRMEARPGDV